MQGLVNRAGDDDTARICRVGVRILQRNEAGEEQTDSGIFFFEGGGGWLVSSKK